MCWQFLSMQLFEQLFFSRNLVTKPILLTSFATWSPHQRHNSSDQLVEIIAQDATLAPYLAILRQLPVNLPTARSLTIYKWQQLRPALLICCGMAESRSQLSLETQGVWGELVLKTSLDLDRLAAELPHTIISYDAGRFVCNSLYHAMLNYLKRYPAHKTLFVHVPLLTNQNREQIVAEFRRLLEILLAEHSG
jgi:pyroglutamyl-peptidase